MNTFPMIRTKLSNEHIMAGVFLVLVLYHLPQWYEDPVGIFRFLLLVGVGLLIDAVASIIRYKRMWCCVSGAVTAAMISLLSVGIPLWVQLLAIAFGLIAGKHVQGGTGRNISNPAMAGMVAILLFFDLPDKLFTSSLLLLPAIVIGLVFLYFRPFAGTAFILGMVAAMLYYKELTFANILSYGVLFWGCMVMTDPVTITPNPVLGALLGFLSSFLAMFFFQAPSVMVAVILFINIFSDEMVEIFEKSKRYLDPKIRIPKLVPHGSVNLEMLDLTNEAKEPDLNMVKKLDTDTISASRLTPEDILQKIKEYEVYGMGGAAFSSYRKIRTVMDAEVEDKYFVINAVECDPGLIHDEWLLQNHLDDILKGAELLNTCMQFKGIHIALKDKGQWMEPSQLMVPSQIKVDQVSDSYPIGAEKILINEVLGEKLKADQIPAVSGILVLNVQTVYSIGQAVLRNKPADTRYLTVADTVNKTAKVVKVRLGMKLQEIVDAIYPGTVNIYAGGGIMQAYLTEEGAVVDRSVNFIATGLMPKYKESPQCSRCGLCSKNCPSGLKVRLIADLVDRGRLQEAVKYKVEECISCGSCSYTCPAGHNLAVRVKKVKDLVTSKRVAS